MKKTVTLALLCLLPLRVQAEDINAVFKRVNDLLAQKSYAMALGELGLARQEIEKLHLQRIQAFLPQTVAGFTGGNIRTGGALGVMTVDREYTKGALTLQLGFRGGNSGNGPGTFGNIAQLGRVVATTQKQPGVESVRIGAQTGIIKASGPKNTLTLFLESGSVLMVAGPVSATNEELRTFAEALDVVNLEKYLSGKV
jgi:hypothetical protein